MPISGFVLALALGSTIHLPPAPHLESPTIEPDNICMEPITVPLVFPVAGKCDWEDSFLAARTGHRHHGQDLMAAKMTPLVACFDGTIKLGRPKTPGGHIWVTVKGDNGWTAQYYHVNNDTPGTNDGTGLDEYAFAPGIKDGDHVEAGQFIAYVGDSGNAEGGPSHCHFELWETGSKACINPVESLKASQKISIDDSDIQAAPKKRVERPVVATPSRHKATAKPVAAKTVGDWQGAVVAVDPLTRRIKVALECARTPGKKPDFRRRSVWLTVPKNALIFLEADPTLTIGMTEVLEGYFVRMDVANPSGAEPQATALAVSTH